MDLLTVTVAAETGRVVVTAAGEVDMLTAPRLRESLEQALAHRAAEILVDISGLTFLSSPGLAVLLDVHAAAERSGSALVILCRDNRVTRRIFAISGLDKVLTLLPPSEAAATSEDDTDRYDRPSLG